MTDRELLELAAKAAEVKGGFEQDPAYKWQERERWVIPYNNNGLMTGVVWNPLDDDGDALRLAVRLGLVVHVWDDADMASVAKTLPDGEDPPPDGDAWHSADAHACGDIYAATRRAIVRAAAEIGKAKP